MATTAFNCVPSGQKQPLLSQRVLRTQQEDMNKGLLPPGREPATIKDTSKAQLGEPMRFTGVTRRIMGKGLQKQK